LKRLVAVKVLSPRHARDERARRRFEREAQAVASLSHPNIVAIYRVGRLSNDIPYIVMQYVKGRNMEERLQAEGALAIDEARAVIADLAAALAAAHKRGIVHRDVRPGNVLRDEETGRILLADFGIAAILASGESGGSERLTKTGELVGDPRYLSPEQLMGEDLSERSDIYALGLLGYEIVAGRGPYDARTKREALTAHVREEPKRLSQLRGDVDPQLDALLMRCLAKEPKHRPNAADIARRLKDVPGALASPAAARPGPTGFFDRIKERRLPQIIIAYGAVAWGVLQVSWLLVESGVFPRIVFQLFLVAVATGFPAVLTGAWFHGKKGEQKFQPVEYWVFGGLALIWVAVSVIILVGWLS
jgi:serine/threonine protein kinase